MRTIQRACLLIASGILLSGCAATQYRSTELAPVCAIPVNRTVQSMYWLDCMSFYSSSDPYSRHY